MLVFQYALMGLSFLLELCGLAAFFYWGFHMNRGWFINSLLGLGTPLLVAIFWGTFIAPKASIPVTFPVRIILKLIVFSFAAAALYFSGKGKLAIIFGAVVLIEMVSVYLIED
jgi:hypothetical protein